MENLFNHKYKNQTFQKNNSRIGSIELSKEEIDENIRQCYNNLKNLKKTFKGRNFDKTYFSNLYNSNKSTPKNKNTNKNSVSNNLNSRPLSNEETGKYLIKNYTNHNLKNSNSTSKIREIYQSKPFFEYNPYQYNINKNTINSNHYNNSMYKNQKNISTSLMQKNNISTQELSKKHNNNDSYILFLQKKLDEQHKNNKSINLNYQDIKTKYEKLSNDNKHLNEKLNMANKQINELEKIKKKVSKNIEIKEKEDQKQIDILKHSLLDYQKVNNEFINQSFTQSKISDNELKSILNNKNNEMEISSLKNQISCLNNNILNKDKTIKHLQEIINKLKEENKSLNEKNIEISNKMISLNEEIKNKDSIILNFQKYQKLSKINQSESQDNSLFESNSHFDSGSKIYKRKTLSEFSIDKGKNNKCVKYIEEIKLKIPSPLKESVNREMPIRKYSIEQLFKENFDGKNKIEMLNKKLEAFTNIESKYEKILSFNQNFKDDESNNFFNSNITPITTLNNIKNNSEKKNELSYELNNSEIINEDIFIYGINKKNLIQFNLQKTVFKNIPLKDLNSDGSFLDNYQYEGSIISNTLDGLYILTGKNIDILYFYDNKTKIIKNICRFENNHNSGSILVNNDKSKIYTFSGKFNRKIELFNYKEGKVKELPECNIERCNATYSLINNNKIFAFFGFCFPQSVYTQSIEYLDLINCNSWKYIFVNNENNFNIQNISSVCLNNDDSILILGGIKENNISNIILEYKISENIIKIKEFQNYKQIYFDKETHFSKFYDKDKKIYYYIGLDCFNNVHILNEKGQFQSFSYK